jgi:hypothetical protein
MTLVRSILDRIATHLFAIQHNTSMNNKAAGLIDTVRKTTTEDKNIDPPLDFCEHQASNRSQSFCILFLLQFFFLLNLVPPIGKGVQCCCIVPRNFPPRSHIRERAGKIPTLEYFFVDKISMICTDDGFGYPSLLEE